MCSVTLPEEYTSTMMEPPGPLVSVIITTYNHAHFLPESRESVQQQTWKNVELIVIDDGSTDNTAAVVAKYPEAKYIHQENSGLSAARNTGVAHATGLFVVFLDADDLLYPHALEINLKYFKLYPQCAFISGGHNLVDGVKRMGYVYDNKQHEPDHYLSLLWDNYIGMHAAVMYRREILMRYPYDVSLPACEDFDIYLRIARSHPVYSHLESLAAYRIHGNNMSKDFSLMATQYLKVLRKNVDVSYSPEVKRIYRQGIRNCKSFYAKQITSRPLPGKYRSLLRYKDLRLVISSIGFHKVAYYTLRVASKGRHFTGKHWGTLREKIKVALGGNSERYPPRLNHVQMGHLRRLTPFSREFGFERGGPVDRYYIEHFLKDYSAVIRGHVLEIGDNAYTTAFGSEQVDISDILHVDASNPKATIIGDLSQADLMADNQFDCIIMTQTLHLIYDFHSALKSCYRILKKGGTLLLTVPGISQIEIGEWSDVWYWSFTGKSIQKLLAESFDPLHTIVQTHGNVLSAAAFLYGMGQQEISNEEKDRHDPKYQVIITAKATKV